MLKPVLFTYLMLIVALITGCQRVIDVSITSASSMLVIEGNITNATGTQTISLSKTVAYTDANVYPAVSGATVSVSSNGVTYPFKETSPGQYTISSIKTKAGQAFTMNVTVDNKTYSAVSVMPAQVNLDSLGVSKISVGSSTVQTVSVFYRDPPDAVNQYRFILYINGVEVKEIFTINDALSNGRVINSMLYEDDITIHSGDKAEVEMQCIDNNVFNYWYSLSQQGGNSPNNSATPSNPVSNISNGALGYFSAHTVQRKSLEIP